MRLLDLNAQGSLHLTEFIGESIPRYVILSHTWGADYEEVTFKDLMEGTGKSKAGYHKLWFCAEQASMDNISYFWVDTCCIDKSSSSELLEAINSMFRWYRNAAKCYVYLSDVSASGNNENNQLVPWESAFRKSRWFTRGWTLQELIAPPSVEFFCMEGHRLGDKKSLETQIVEVTGLPVLALQGCSLSQFSNLERISWGAKRETKRPEDKAYSLLGIFEVYMPLINGEGEKNAFNRLREEIDRRARNYELDKAMFYDSNEISPIKTLSSQVVSDTATKTAFKGISEASRTLITSWLQPASVAEDLKELLDQRHPSTCRWIFDTPEFKSWQASLHPTLWIYGKPGSGKSMIAAALIEQLQTEDIITAYFFCRVGDDSRRSIESILQTWLWQVLEQMPEFTETALKNHGRGPEIRGQLEPVKKTLAEAVSQSSKTICLIVDGLDECESGPSFAEKLIDFVSTLGPKSLFVVISRPEIWIRKALDTVMQGKCCTVQVTNKATEDDLGQWI